MIKKILQQNYEHIKDGVIILLFFLYFRSNLVWVYNYFVNAASYEYSILFFVSLVILVFATKGKYSFRTKNEIPLHPFMLFSSAIFLDLFNIFFLHYQIISATAMILAGYAILGLYLERDVWKRCLFIVGIIALSLPFAEHIQTILGFPIRLLTAKIVSFIMSLLGLASINDATIIVTENNATSIDVPCSGIKSIYSGIIVLFLILFLKRARFSWKVLIIALGYFFLLLFFNIWRVFSLVYVYDVLNFPAFGNAIHIGIGIVGFILSILALWYLIEKFISPKPTHEDKKVKQERFYNKYTVIILLILSFALDSSYLRFQGDVDKSIESIGAIFYIENLQLQEVPFTQQEEQFFVNRDVQFSKKYAGQTQSGLKFSLLLISSNSWRTHHNPELCLQGTGHQIEKSEIVQIDDLVVRKLSLNQEKDSVLYWFTNGNKNVADYSQRVWEGLKNPKNSWTLVEVGFQGNLNLDDPDLNMLIRQLRNGVEQLNRNL